MGKFKLGDRVKIKNRELARYYGLDGDEHVGAITKIGTFEKIGPFGYTVDFGHIKKIVLGKDMDRVNE